LSQTKLGDSPHGTGESLGLNCTADGLSLAGVSLLRAAVAGFVPRSAGELGELMKYAYDHDVDLTALSSGLDVVAKALNDGDLGRAMIAAMHLKLPELSWSSAARVAHADGALCKFDVDELRDWLGRWTTGGAAKPRATPTVKPQAARTPSGSTPRREGMRIVSPAAAAVAIPMRSTALAPTQIAGGAAVGEEVAGGGPLDPFADILAAVTLGAGLLLEARSRSGSRSGRRVPSRARSLPLGSYDDECEDLLNRESINCKIVGATRGAWKGEVCRQTAFTRYAECLRHGPSGITTPLYEGD
jgi:hypothetical protein